MDKKNLLFIDIKIPRYDEDAGSKTIFQFLKLFVNIGFNVTFIGNDFIHTEPYTSVLHELGIEILSDDYYKNNWKFWLRDNSKNFDIAFLSRPEIFRKYFKIIKKHTAAKIIYYGHDLHYLRDQREYMLTKDIRKLRSSKILKKIELSIMKNADVVYYPSSKEIEIIKEIDPSINCKTIPMNIYPKNILKDYNKTKKDLIFVGGFIHSPNVDAVLWFVNNIFPYIIKEIPDIILNIIGSNVPDQIKTLENNNIKILGYVDDNTLDEYYNKCRICIAPLRYGAGVKGKIIEAMYKQIPVITTTIGAEGLPDIEDCLIIEDDPKEYANKLINMYKNNDVLKTLIEKSHNYIMENFTEDKAKNIILEDFNTPNNTPA